MESPLLARSSRNWSVARMALRALLIAALWLGSVLATYRYAFDVGYEEEFKQRLSADYVQYYAVGDLLETHTPQQLTARIQSLAPLTSWDDRGGSGSMTYFETNQSFVVHHSGTIHDDIAELLARLRKE